MIRSIIWDKSYLEGVAALYAYESQIPKIATIKINDLRKFYDIQDETALSFFTVHQEADVHHSAAERNILSQYAISSEEKEAVLDAAARSARAMLRLLDGVYERYVN